MSPKRIQLFLILGVSAMTLLLSIQFGSALFEFATLQNRTKVHVYQWETVEIKSRFALKVKYEFTSQEKSVQGAYTFRPPYYLNEFAAIAAMREKAKQPHFAWYNPKNPSYSVLEKLFPSGLLIRTVICYGVLIYFLYLYKRLFRL